MISAALAGDLADMAALMAASPLLRRYRISYAGAIESLYAALAAGDVLLCSREPAGGLGGLAWVSSASGMLNVAAYLRLLLVAAPASGTGSRLLMAAEGAARASANHLYLLVTSDNTLARRFYEHRGFRHVGDLPGLVWPDLDEALYHKPLRDHANRLGR